MAFIHIHISQQRCSEFVVLMLQSVNLATILSGVAPKRVLSNEIFRARFSVAVFTSLYKFRELFLFNYSEYMRSFIY